MNITRFTFYIGIAFIVAGIAGFIPGLLHAPHMDDPSLVVENSYGRLFGLFPVNVLHNIVHIFLGIAALISSKTIVSSTNYCKCAAVFYGFLTLIGIVPALNTMFGLVPVFGHDVW